MANNFNSRLLRRLYLRQMMANSLPLNILLFQFVEITESSFGQYTRILRLTHQNRTLKTPNAEVTTSIRKFKKNNRSAVIDVTTVGLLKYRSEAVTLELSRFFNYRWNGRINYGDTIEKFSNDWRCTSASQIF